MAMTISMPGRSKIYKTRSVENDDEGGMGKILISEQPSALPSYLRYRILPALCKAYLRSRGRLQFTQALWEKKPILRRPQSSVEYDQLFVPFGRHHEDTWSKLRQGKVRPDLPR